MERSALLAAYTAACRKAAANARVIGRDLREFPGQMDGNYFAPARDSLRPVEHIFCWTPSFFTGIQEPFQNGQNRPVDVAGARYYVMDFWLPNTS